MKISQNPEYAVRFVDKACVASFRIANLIEASKPGQTWIEIVLVNCKTHAGELIPEKCVVTW